MLVKCLIGKNQGLNSNHKVQTSNLKVQRIRSSKITLMTTVANCGLSLQITRQLVNSSTRTLVNLTKWGYPAFHAPPYGGGVGGGASWATLLLCALLLCFLVLTTSSLQILRSLYPSHARRRNGQQWR